MVPGKDITGEGVVIELDGVIVNLRNPVAGSTLKSGEEVGLRAEIKML